MTYKLKDLFELQMGKTPSRNNANYWGGCNKWISIADIGNATKYIENTKECITDTAVEESSIKVVPKGTVIMSFKLSIGKAAITTEDMFTNEAIMAFIDKGICPIDINYFYHFCCGKDWLAGTNKAVMGLTLNKATLSEIKISVPNIEIQRKIASKLDKIDELIAMRKKELDMLVQLVKSRFIEMFGDGHDGKTPVKMLGSICQFQQGTQVPVEEQIEEPLAGYKRFLRIIDYTQAPQPPRYVNVSGKEIDEKSVVIVRYGATAGFVGRGYKGILANNLFEIMPNETLLSKDFLFLALKYGTFEKDVHDKAFGAAMPALSFSMMNDITVVMPTEELQQRFIDFFEQIDKSKYYCVLTLKIIEKLLAEVKL